MELPRVRNRLVDKSLGVVYDVVAYRRLARDELLAAVRAYAAGRRGRPKRGTLVTIVSIIGHDGVVASDT